MLTGTQNSFPCRKCNQPEYGLYHTLEQMMMFYMMQTQRHIMLGEYERSDWSRKQAEQINDDARKQGWDGHHYDPLDNLEYLELKVKEKGQ